MRPIPVNVFKQIGIVDYRVPDSEVMEIDLFHFRRAGALINQIITPEFRISLGNNMDSKKIRLEVRFSAN